MRINTIICGDAMEELKKLPDKCIDMVLIDPPYLQDSHGGGGAFGTRMRNYHKGVDSLGYGFDNFYLEEIVRLCKKLNAYIFCSKNQLLQILNYFQKYKYDILTYHKTNPSPTCNNKYLPDTEYIIYVRESGVRLYGTYHTKKKYFVQENSKSEFKHPTVKPLNIISTLIENSTIKGDLVIDFFLGSGTTAVACKQLNRNYIGIELNSDYVKIAKERLKMVQDKLL